ncbi:transporter, major facilitator family protein [Caballeronia glebae]|uniref:Transporter, major facilitator family protein n=1 Tax=Caballeronia glebae TaxID=1777143 RepID=A0A157ZTS7_9BURK|nr:MFS transporter [Caballeronia glebae]SAK48903.1 transporter, major facilitator family protein [Caballeronia glebae]
MSSTVRLRVFSLFAAGYFVSYVFRGVNLGFAPLITHELGLSGADLGLLTALYFIGFAAAQIPVGVLLDHFGPARVTAGMLVFAAAGIGVFGASHGLAGLMAGRLLIGVGVSVCLAAAFKASAQQFPISRLPLINGFTMAVGGLGGVVVGSPLSSLLQFATWRQVSFGLVVFTLAVAGAIALFAPSKPDTHHQADIVTQFKGTWHIMKSAAFWKIASFPVVTQGVFYAMQSLWISPYLIDVMNLTPAHSSAIVSVLGFAMMFGSIGFGAAARSLERRGVSVYAFCGAGMVLFVVTQLLMMLRVPLPPAALIIAYGVFGGTGILSYAVAAKYFPSHMAGRVNTTLTLVIFLLIFGFQVGVGAMLSLWPEQAGRYPASAHIAVWAVLVALQVASAIWYMLPGRALHERGSEAGSAAP